MKKILLVEDERDISHMYRTKFRLEGFQIITAKNGNEGLQQIASFRPDLILLDIDMPGMNGLQMLNIIKKAPKTRNIPVIMLTNHSNDDMMKEAIEVGAEAYLIKGEVEPRHVVRMVQGMLLYSGSSHLKG
jgi:CheY-like chemotaxis protein